MIDDSETMGRFESWLLRRVAQAIEAREVSSDLLAELREEFAAAREKPPEVGMAQAIRTFAEIAGISHERAEEMLASVELLPVVTREMILQRVAEAWLEDQRRVGGIDGSHASSSSG